MCAFRLVRCLRLPSDDINNILIFPQRVQTFVYLFAFHSKSIHWLSWFPWHSRLHHPVVIVFVGVCSLAKLYLYVFSQLLKAPLCPSPWVISPPTLQGSLSRSNAHPKLSLYYFKCRIRNDSLTFQFSISFSLFHFSSILSFVYWNICLKFSCKVFLNSKCRGPFSNVQSWISGLTFLFECRAFSLWLLMYVFFEFLWFPTCRYPVSWFSDISVMFFAFLWSSLIF